MKHKKKLIFVGSFLAKKKGTHSVAEKISDFMADYYDVSLVSHHSNQFLRMLDIVFSLLFKSYDIAHIDVFSGKAFFISEWASIIAKSRGKKIVLTLHGGRLNEFYHGNETRFEKLFSRAHKITTPSKYLVECFKDLDPDIEYIPNFIDIQKFPYKGLEERKNLLWVRAFTDVYHPELAIDTLKKLHQHYPDLRLTMIGPDKGKQGQIELYVQARGLEKYVDFIGKVDNSKLSKYYQRHSVYLNTTRYESFGIAVVEAAASGIPIVSCKVGEIPYLWGDEEDMMIIGERKAEQMAQAVKLILQNEAVGEKLSQNARKKAEALDWKHVKQQWLDVIGSVEK